MSITSVATYSKGSLLLPGPLELPEGAKVWLQIQTESGPKEAFVRDPLEQVIGIGESGRANGAEKHDEYLKPKVA